MKHCSPTWGAACWKTAPTPRSGTAVPTRAYPSKTWCAAPCSGSSRPPASKAWPACPTPASRCRKTCTARSAPTRSGWIWPTKTPWPDWPPRCKPAPARHGAPLRCRPRTPETRQTPQTPQTPQPPQTPQTPQAPQTPQTPRPQPCPPAARPRPCPTAVHLRRQRPPARPRRWRRQVPACATPPTSAMWSARCKRPAPPRPGRPCTARSRPQPPGRPRRRPSAPPGCGVPPICCSSACRCCSVCWCARPAKVATAPSPKCARPRTFPPPLPLGPVVCISPWNFPLPIFTGQVAAALAAGNPVLAKPAEQTPLIAAEAVRILWQAGIPRGAVQLLPGPGDTVGARLVADARVQGVMFTGSTEVARTLQRQLAGRLDAAGRPVTLIAETGGQNAMIVDSSALVEQVVGDVLASAFDSAGQRCSALRVLCVQQEVADRVLTMLQGAMDELCIGNPGALQVDMRPVIDAQTRAGILAHIQALRAKGQRVFQPGRSPANDTTHGHFVPPTLIEINHIGQLQAEVFGPVLHLLRYARQDLEQLLDQINATGYGLTLGLHSRIDETMARVLERSHAGNIYVNRNMVGAVVGVQPFGGEGLSGTCPKTGGTLNLLQLRAPPPCQAPARMLGPD